jgi:hypothetical protein
MLASRRAASSLFHQAVKATNILHITDHEGTRFFFDALNKSSIVSLKDDGLHFNKSSSFFIFGGDATDRGTFDLATTTLLVDFKKRHPNQVALLAGNRDIKNTRFHRELAPELIRERVLHSKPARWLPVKHQTTPFDFLKARMAFKDDAAARQFVKALPIEECQIIYLLWMLENNMGSPATFDYRREELQRAGKKTVTDRDVLNSFLTETSPMGVMGEYLKLSQLGVIVPHTRVLAVHGGLTKFNIGRIPGMAPAAKPIADARLWINKLNAWYAQQIKLWSDYHPTALTEPASTELDDAVLPIPGKSKQVVTADMLTPGRRFTQISDEVDDYLLANKISVVLTGHQPCGDHPALLRNQRNNLLFINGDTGYADFNPSKPSDTRGVACHSLELSADTNKTVVTIDAITAQAITVKTSLTLTPDAISNDNYIGRVLRDGYLVQCKLSSEEYRLVKQEGFEISYKNISAAELKTCIDDNIRPIPMM